VNSPPESAPDANKPNTHSTGSQTDALVSNDSIATQASTRASLIIVLGAAVKAQGVPSNALRRRVEHAVGLWEAGAAPQLLMSGGLGKYPPAEAEVMQRLALDLGVAENAILIEPLGVSTLDSARKCAALLKKIANEPVTPNTLGSPPADHPVMLVTDDFHMRRALMAFRHVGIETHGNAVSASMQHLSLWRSLFYRFREAVALLWYGILLQTP
jgi:vancomycin permeability regulator SanA